MSKTTLNRFSWKRNNVKIFLFFLLFTSLLWVFIQFSKSYTQELEIGVVYKNIPEGKLLNPGSDRFLKLILNGNGFQLMNYNWKQPQVVFDLEDANTATELNYYFMTSKQQAFLKEKLNFKGAILSIQKDSLQVFLDEKLEKKIPVLMKGSVDFAPGYGSYEGMILSPDSIQISGPFGIVDTLRKIYTREIKLEELKNDFSETVVLETNTFPETVSFNEKSVEAAISVSKFTEGSQEILISLINVPKDKNITIFPKKIKVVYQVGLQKYDQVAAADFKVIADYKNATENSSYLILELIKKPAIVYDVRLPEKQVQYVIINQEE